MARRLNLKQLAFVKLYLGDDPEIAGNATACYRVAYQSKAKPKTIHSMSSTLMRNPLIQARIQKATTRAVAACDWSARTVLEQSIKLYDRCMGEGDYAFNPQGARAALELIGRNTGIQAFTENIEVSHTHRLEQALSRRAKVIEGRAVPMPAIGEPVDQVPHSMPGDVHAPGQESEPGPPPGNGSAHLVVSDPPGQRPGGSEKEGASSGG